MSHVHDHDADHESVYDGLTGGDDSQWAFGTDFEDPLAGVDTTIPDGVDARTLADYCLIDLADADGTVRRVAASHADPARQPLVERLRDYPPDGDRAAVGVAKVLRTGEPVVVPEVTDAGDTRTH